MSYDEGEEESGLCEEALRVRRWRCDAAIVAGFSIVEAKLFAESDADLETLRHLAAAGCDPETLRRIML